MRGSGPALCTQSDSSSTRASRGDTFASWRPATSSPNATLVSPRAASFTTSSSRAGDPAGPRSLPVSYETNGTAPATESCSSTTLRKWGEANSTG